MNTPDVPVLDLPEPDVLSLTPEILPPTPRPDIAVDLKKRQYERDARYRRLKQQLRDLMERVQQRRTSETSAPSVTVVPAEKNSASANSASVNSASVDSGAAQAEPSPSSPDTPAETKKPEEPVAFPPEPSLNDAVAVDESESESAEPPSAENDSVFLESLKAAAVVDGPVDRVGLADNLYALKEFSIALEMYQKVSLKDLPASERYWVSFQMASCHRKLNQKAEAQQLYRRLAGQKSAGWLATTARWWLDQMDARNAMEKALSENSEILEKVTTQFPEQQPDVVSAPDSPF